VGPDVYREFSHEEAQMEKSHQDAKAQRRYEIIKNFVSWCLSGYDSRSPLYDILRRKKTEERRWSVDKRRCLAGTPFDPAQSLP